MLLSKIGLTSIVLFTVLGRLSAAPSLDWSQTYFKDIRAVDITVLSDNSVVIAGQKNTNTVIVKVNADGDTLWTQKWNNSPTIIKELNDGDLLVGGSNINHLTKLRADGEVIWQKYYWKKNSIAYGIDVFPNDGGIAICLFGGGTSSAAYHLDLDGNAIDSVELSGTATSIIAVDENAALVSGYKDYRISAWKIDFQQENIEWEKQYDKNTTTRRGSGDALAISEDGGFLIGGQDGLNGTAWRLIKTDAEGNKTKSLKYDYGQSGLSGIFSIAHLENDNYLVCGLTHMIEIEETGTVVSERKLGINFAVNAQKNGQGAVMVGGSDGNGDNRKLYLAKYADSEIRVVAPIRQSEKNIGPVKQINGALVIDHAVNRPYEITVTALNGRRYVVINGVRPETFNLTGLPKGVFEYTFTTVGIRQRGLIVKTK